MEKYMKKRYLEPGESIEINFYGHVGLTGTIIDIQADLTAMVESCGNDPNTDVVGASIGTIRRDGYISDVFVDIDTGRLWHNDDWWY